MSFLKCITFKPGGISAKTRISTMGKYVLVLIVLETEQTTGGHYSGISLRRTHHKADTSIKRTHIQGTDGFLVNFSQASLYKADNYKADIL